MFDEETDEMLKATPSEKKKEEVILLNVSKDDTNMKLSVAHSVLDWIGNLFSSKKEGK